MSENAVRYEDLHDFLVWKEYFDSLFPVIHPDAVACAREADNAIAQIRARNPRLGTNKVPEALRNAEPAPPRDFSTEGPLA
jgi:hypothetical protein